MSVYNINGELAASIYDINGTQQSIIYDINGNEIRKIREVDYSKYSFVQKWSSKGISNAQGFDIYDGKVFWISMSGNSTVPANCYVWNLSDGSQALDTPFITVYSGHGNNVSFDFPTIYASPAYPPSIGYVNLLTNEYVATLIKTLSFNDGSTDCDICIDESDNTILWTLGHTANSQDRSAPYYISKWDLSDLTDNGDGTYTPNLLKTVQTPQPQSSYFFQGVKMHDSLLWYCNGRGGAEPAYVRAVNPNNGVEEYIIDCNTASEPEGVAWVEDATSVGGYALYVGFQGMMLRKYIFETS